ncbi:MAG TPA: cation:proton antiporter [Nitrospiraceae bacterium]|nr:cation:proton antiporter [Nitrospiraceae bacterium]
MELKQFILSLVVILVCTRVMVELAIRIGQSAVLGELAAGVLIGGGVLGWVEPTQPLTLMGEIGVMLLLFEVGLKSDLHSFLKVGWRAAAVAAIGVVTPFVLGYGFALVLHMSQLQAVFIGATLTATSVGFSARVLQDLGKLTTPEGNIILGAAVIDDVLGLVILSVIMGLAESGTVSWLAAIRTAVLAFLFLGVAILIGIRCGHWFTGIVNRMNSRGKLIVAAMVPVLLFGYVAELLHVAALIGAFAAGLVLAKTEHHTHIEDTIKPVADIFVPIFFVLVGAAVNPSLLNPFNQQNWPILLLAAGLTVAAVLGKLAAGLGAGGTVNRLAVGIGMLPRGEVGLIFAGIGLTSAIISTAEYGAILLVVTLTTMLAPLLLKRCFRTA